MNSPRAFKASFVTLEAEPSFLAEALIEIRVRGWRSEQSWTAQGTLDEGARELAVFVPHDVMQAELLATAVSRKDGSRINTFSTTCFCLLAYVLPNDNEEAWAAAIKFSVSVSKSSKPDLILFLSRVRLF